MSDTLSDVRRRQAQAHRDKCERWAQQIGVPALCALLEQSGLSRERIRKSTDPYLNDIPLRVWDRIAGVDGVTWFQQAGSEHMVWTPLWRLGPKVQSLGERVSVLKHAARVHYAPEGEVD